MNKPENSNLDDCTHVAPRGEFKPSEVSLCKNCNSMTYTIKGKCGKCKKDKPENSNHSQQTETRDNPTNWRGKQDLLQRNNSADTHSHKHPRRLEKGDGK